MKTIRLITAVMLFLCFNVNASEIVIDITGSKERQDYSGKDICELQYSITNNSFGTVYYLSVSVDGWDDRGDKLDEVLSSSFTNGGGFRGKTPIAVGTSLDFTMDTGFKSKCQYVAEVKVTGIKPEYCNIRMMPENASCEEIVKVKSSVANITIK